MTRLFWDAGQRGAFKNIVERLTSTLALHAFSCSCYLKSVNAVLKRQAPPFGPSNGSICTTRRRGALRETQVIVIGPPDATGFVHREMVMLALSEPITYLNTADRCFGW